MEEMVEKTEKIEKKHNVFKRLHASKKAQVLFFIITMSALLVVWVIVNVKMYNNPILLDDDFSWVYQFERVSKSGETVEITGWAFPVNEGVSSRSFEIILSNLDCQQYVFTEMDFCLRNDVNSYFLCDIDYSKSGFKALVDAKNVNFTEDSYEFLIREKGSRYAQKTGVFIVNGEISYISPLGYVELDAEGSNIQNIVDNGILKVYRPEVGMYVYQYEDDLYWIADGTYQFIDNGTYIQFQTYTTQPEKLPANRVERNLNFDDIGFYFEKNQVESLSDEKYKVAKITMPNTYSIKMLETGYYVNGEWIWMSRFRPEYDF